MMSLCITCHICDDLEKLGQGDDLEKLGQGQICDISGTIKDTDLLLKIYRNVVTMYYLPYF